MRIEFNPDKDRTNISIHGVSLVLAEKLAWDLMICREDDRGDYGELRLVGHVPIGNIVYTVAFTVEEGCYRIISLRKAEPKEVRYYASQL